MCGQVVSPTKLGSVSIGTNASYAVSIGLTLNAEFRMPDPLTCSLAFLASDGCLEQAYIANSLLLIFLSQVQQIFRWLEEISERCKEWFRQ